MIRIDCALAEQMVKALSDAEWLSAFGGEPCTSCRCYDIREHGHGLDCSLETAMTGIRKHPGLEELLDDGGA